MTDEGARASLVAADDARSGRAGADSDAPRPVPTTGDPDAPGWAPDLPDAEGVRADVALAVALFVGALLSTVLWRVTGLFDDPAPAWVAVLVLAATTLPLALRRRRPSIVVLVVAAAFIGGQIAGVPEVLVSNICLFLALYSVGAWESVRRRALASRTVVVVAMFAWLLIALFHQATAEGSADDELSRVGAFSPLVAYLLIQLLTNVLYFSAAWWFGEHAWASAKERARTAWRGRQLAAERLRVEQQAVALERVRLARELHDAVAHHVATMGVQASAARTVLTAGDPQRTAGLLLGVEESARRAVDELHGILGMLRAGPEQESEAVGGLGVEKLPALVEQTRALGMDVSLQVVGDPAPLPPLASLNLYRIAQEALTNVRKHAGVGARGQVRLRYQGQAVELEVSDDGSGRGRAALPSTGLGLVGMRERVAADGGELVVGPLARGGFVVRARLPLATAGTTTNGAPPATTATTSGAAS